MGLITYLTYTAFALTTLTHALPSPVQTITVIPLAAPSKYPGTPVTNEIQYVNWDEKDATDKADRTTIHNAFVPWANVIQKARESLLDQNDKTYDRWFPENVKDPNGGQSKDGRGYVTGMFAQIHKYDTSNPAPLATMTAVVADKQDETPPACKANTNAYLYPSTGRFHICKPKGLSQVTAATDVKCSDLGTQVSQKMQSLTGSLVHEFMHWDHVGKDYSGSVGRITDYMYGSGNCARMRDGPDKQDTFKNADSYKWFALNAYYNSVCGKNFGDPLITADDFQQGMDELMASPLYNATLSDGLLAGV